MGTNALSTERLTSETALYTLKSEINLCIERDSLKGVITTQLVISLNLITCAPLLPSEPLVTQYPT